MTATPGCLEHQSKLASIIQDPRKNRKSLTVYWVDLVNAYTSFYQLLTDFSLKHYHPPTEFRLMVESSTEIYLPLLFQFLVVVTIK